MVRAFRYIQADMSCCCAGDRSSSTQWHTTNTGFFSSNAHVVLHGQEVQQLVAGSRSNSLKMLAKPLGGLNFCYKWILGISLQLRVKMWNWNIWCWICFHQRRCAARKRVIFNETHFVTEFGQHIVTNVNLCSLHVPHNPVTYHLWDYNVNRGPETLYNIIPK